MQIIIQALSVIQVMLFAYFILSWFPLQSGGFFHQIWSLLDRVFEPVLRGIRSKLPRTGMIDLSGMVLFIGIAILQSILVNYS